MNCLRRLKSEAVGELFVRRGVPGLGLIYEGLAETFFQHAIVTFQLRDAGSRASPLAANSSRYSRQYVSRLRPRSRRYSQL